MLCKITVAELRHCMTGKKSGRKTGLFCPLVGWYYLGQEIHEVKIRRYGIVEYHNKDNKLIGCFDGCAFFGRLVLCILLPCDAKNIHQKAKNPYQILKSRLRIYIICK